MKSKGREGDLERRLEQLCLRVVGKKGGAAVLRGGEQEGDIGEGETHDETRRLY